MKVSYHIRPLPMQHELAIEARFEGVEGSLALATPTWVPGAYGFMKYGRDIFDLTATDAASGQKLLVRREGWSGFVVAQASGKICLRYRVNGLDHAWGELVGLVDHENAVLLATRCLFAPAHDGPVNVAYDLPEGWRLHHPAGAREIAPHTFEYQSYAMLLDTPVVVGRFDLISRTSAGVPFHFAFLDKTIGFEREAEGFVEILMRIASACHALFGSYPFESYTFVFTFNPLAKWGLEHASSTMIALHEEALIDKTQRARAVRVAAHELFHAWNVCRLKPAPLGKPDHVAGSFPDSLWVGEGLTRYYEFLLGVRAGELAPEVFFANLVNYYRQLTAQPAYARVTAADSSLATFLNHNRYPGSINSTIDYYDKGMLIAFDIDAHLRLQTPASSLDRLFKELYDAFAGKGDGLTHGQAREFFAGRAAGLGELIEREVEHPAGLSTLAWLERLGFRLETKAVRYLGLVLAEDNQGPSVANVLDTSPAGQSGLAPGDEIVRAQGFPFSLKALRWLTTNEDRVVLEVLRGHQCFTFAILVGERPDITALLWDGDATQLERLRTWLGRPGLTLERHQPVSLESHETFHGIQTVL